MSKRTRNIQIAFWLFDFLLLAAALILIIGAEVFKASDGNGTELGSNTLRRLVISNDDILGAVVLGGIYLSANVLSVPAYISSKRRTVQGAYTTLLAGWNWYLILTGCATLSVGLAIWFFTLNENSEFLAVWNAQDPATQGFIQDQLQCCGWFNATSTGFFTSPTGFCANVANVTADPCNTPFVNFADYTLNNIFSTIFGFMAIQVCLFFASLCVINDRHEVERFRRIDEKRGIKGGFV